MDQQRHDALRTPGTEEEKTRNTALVRDGWWLLVALALLLFLLRAA